MVADLARVGERKVELYHAACNGLKPRPASGRSSKGHGDCLGHIAVSCRTITLGLRGAELCIALSAIPRPCAKEMRIYMIVNSR